MNRREFSKTLASSSLKAERRPRAWCYRIPKLPEIFGSRDPRGFEDSIRRIQVEIGNQRLERFFGIRGFPRRKADQNSITSVLKHFENKSFLSLFLPLFLSRSLDRDSNNKIWEIFEKNLNVYLTLSIKTINKLNVKKIYILLLESLTWFLFFYDLASRKVRFQK